VLIHTPTKKVVLNLRDPLRVTTVIPSAKVFTYKGAELVAVPHRIDEVRVLRNLGIQAPSPIRHHYPWSGSYTPFHAQEETAEFLTMNPRAFCLNDLGCVDADTEYLTPTGWKRITDYAGGKVAQYLPDSGAIEFVEPLEYVKKPCREMVRIKTKYGLDQLLSPEHRVLLHGKCNPAKQEVVQAAELLRRHDVQHMQGVAERKSLDRIGFSQATIPVTFEWAGGQGVALTDAQLRLQVAVIADAHFPNNTLRCVVRLKKERKVARLRELLRAAHIAFSEEAIFANRSDVGFHIFSFDAPLRLKEFDARFWAATSAQLDTIADEALRWDGHELDDRRCFISTSKASADFIQFVFASRGFTSRILEDNRDYACGGPCYTVNIRSNGKPLQIRAVQGDGTPLATMWREPSTDGFKYCFMVPSTFLLFRRNGCVFASGNTGKTLAALWAYDYLRSVGKVRKLLVVSPLSTLERTWADEIFRHFPHLTCAVLHGTKDRRLKLLASDADIFLINHDGVKVMQKELEAREEIDIVVVDEVAMFRTHTAARWKALNAITSKRAWVWGLTGTPTPNAPTDAWAQVKLIAPQRAPRYFGQFRDSVMRRINQFRWVPKSDATAIVADTMQPAIRFRREDCVDLPECMVVDRHAPLTGAQESAYAEMRNRLATEVEGGQILAVNEAVKLSKLVQIACGVVYALDGSEKVIPAEPRLNVVQEIIEQADGKVIVFVPFKSVLSWVTTMLSREYSCAQISGDTPAAERARIFDEFQRGKSLQVLVAQPAAMSHGLTLTAANTVVWYAPIFSHEVYQQANARVSRPGQQLQQFIVNISGTEVERRIYTRLRDKEAMQGLLLEAVRGVS